MDSTRQTVSERSSFPEVSGHSSFGALIDEIDGCPTQRTVEPVVTIAKPMDTGAVNKDLSITIRSTPYFDARA